MTGWRLASTGESPSAIELDAAKYRFITVIEGAARVAHHISVSEGWSSPPFDRLLIAQAISDGLTIVTRDPAFAAYEVQTIPG